MAADEPTYEEIDKALAEARQAMEEFKRTRLVTEAMLNGVIPTRKGLSREQIMHTIRAARDPLMEKRAARDVRDFMRLLLGREPTLQELRDGIPHLSDVYGEETDLGLIPLLLAAAPVVLGGAWGLSSVFSYMTAHEQRAQQELSEQATFWDAARAWALPATLALGVGALGWVWVTKRRRPKPKRAEAAPLEKAAMQQNPDDEDDEDDEDEDTTLLPPAEQEPAEATEFDDDEVEEDEEE